MTISKDVWGVWQQNPARDLQKYIEKVAWQQFCFQHRPATLDADAASVQIFELEDFDLDLDI